MKTHFFRDGQAQRVLAGPTLGRRASDNPTLCNTTRMPVSTISTGPGRVTLTRKQGQWPETSFPESAPLAPAVRSGRSAHRRFRRAIECSGRRGIRKFGGQYPKRGGLAGTPRPATRCDCAVTSALRGGVSAHLGITTVLKRQPLRPNWTELNWRLAGSTPVSATNES